MVAQAAQRDGLLLDCLRVVLAVAGVVGVGVLTNVDFELWTSNHVLSGALNSPSVISRS